jgi:hypothetical protein
MISRVDDRLREQIARFSLRYTCEACVHFERDVGACSNGYSTIPHRQTDIRTTTELVFCKAFELA